MQSKCFRISENIEINGNTATKFDTKFEIRHNFETKFEMQVLLRAQLINMLNEFELIKLPCFLCLTEDIIKKEQRPDMG